MKTAGLLSLTLLLGGVMATAQNATNAAAAQTAAKPAERPLKALPYTPSLDLP